MLPYSEIHRTALSSNFEAILGFSVPSIISVNANHNVMCSPSLAGNDSRLLKNIKRNCNSVWIFCQGKEADVALILQVTRMRKIVKICEANLTSQLLPKTGRSQSNEPWNMKQIQQSWIANYNLKSTPASKHVKRSAKMKNPKHGVIQKLFDVNSGQDAPVRYPKSLFWNPTGFHWVSLLRYPEASLLWYSAGRRKRDQRIFQKEDKQQ